MTISSAVDAASGRAMEPVKPVNVAARRRSAAIAADVPAAALSDHDPARAAKLRDEQLPRRCAERQPDP